MSSPMFSRAESLKSGLGPFRTARSRPGRQSQSSPARVAAIQPFLKERSQAPIGFARQHRRTSSAPASHSVHNQPVTTPKPRRALPAETDSFSHSYAHAPSPPVAVSTPSKPPPVSFRQSLQSLARAGSFSLLRTPKARDSSTTRELYTTDEEDNSDGSRFDILSSDPFRSESPFPISDIEDLPPPPVPPKPLHIIPPSELSIPEENQSPAQDSTPTPTSATVLAMRQAFNRMTNSAGKSRIRLLSFIKEAKSPVTATAEEGERETSNSREPPRLQLPDLHVDGPLFDASSFQLPEIPLPKKKIRVEGPTLGHAAPPPVPLPPPQQASTTGLGQHPGPSALQLHLHGNGDFEGYIIASPAESIRVPTPPPRSIPPPLPSPPIAPREPPAWIKKFREELEELAGQALNLTSFPDRLVLELPEEPGQSGETRRRTLVFQDESTPELTYDSVSVSSFSVIRKTPKPPTRPIPPTPVPEIPEAGGNSDITDYSSWTPRDIRASLYTIKSSTTWDPDLPIPSIPDQDSTYLSSGDDEEDDLTIRTARPQPHVFLPAVSKQQAIEEAIRKIQRKAQFERISVIEETEEDSGSEQSSEPPSPVVNPTPLPALFRKPSNPFSPPFDSNTPSRSDTAPPVSRSHRDNRPCHSRTLIVHTETAPQSFTSA